MNYLLDTHTFIWSVMDSKKLSASVKRIISDESNSIFITPFTFWEIAIKVKMKKFSFGNIDIRTLPNIANDFGFELLACDGYDCVTSFELPLVEGHKDPFDRMLIHLAIRKNMILLSKDSEFEKYTDFGLQLKWK